MVLENQRWSLGESPTVSFLKEKAKAICGLRARTSRGSLQIRPRGRRTRIESDHGAARCPGDAHHCRRNRCTEPTAVTGTAGTADRGTGAILVADTIGGLIRTSTLLLFPSSRRRCPHRASLSHSRGRIPENWDGWVVLRECASDSCVPLESLRVEEVWQHVHTRGEASRCGAANPHEGILHCVEEHSQHWDVVETD